MDPGWSTPRRVLAVDWSGARHGARRKIVLAEARDGELVRIEDGRDRDEVVTHLIACAAEDPSLLVGLDFSFSFPAWFLEAHGVCDLEGAWRLAARRGELWLAECPPPFWGRPGRPRPAFTSARSAFRVTEGECLPVGGIGPKSVFQIGGAGSVGAGSLRGMPLLLELAAAGFSIWPRDPARLPLALEIYPRHFTARVTKSRRAARQLWLAAHAAQLAPELTRAAEASEDAFDAAVSARAMARAAERAPPPGPDRDDDVHRMEGRIWRPALERLPAPRR